MKKIVAAILALTCLISIFTYSKWNTIFQKGNPIPYLIAASKITDENPYVEVDKNVFISKLGECPELFEDFEKSLGVEFTEQAGNGYIFTDDTKSCTISSEIYWGKYLVWTLPTADCSSSSTEPTTSIETLTFGSPYDKMSFLGESDSITPIKEESAIINKGYFVTAEYDGLMITLSAKSDFSLTASSYIIAITSLSSAYTDSYGMKVGMPKEELMQKYSLSENDFLSGEENAVFYRIPDNNFISHNIPAYDCFYVAENDVNPVTLIYLIRDESINGILLRHLTAD